MALASLPAFDLNSSVRHKIDLIEAGTLRPDKREGIAHVRWFPIPHALDRIHRDRVRGIAQHASTLLQHTPAAH